MGGPAVSVSIVVPAYNEAGQIASVLDSILAQLRQLEGSWELLVVDDGSADGTAAAASGVDPLIRVVRHPCNLGNGAAVKTGIRHARGEVVILMDGDGQHDAADIPRFIEECRSFRKSIQNHKENRFWGLWETGGVQFVTRIRKW